MARKSTKSSPKRRAFFKPLVGDFSQHLCLPLAFTEHFERFPSKCVLRSPSGKFWTVGLEERDGKIFFHKGWQRFVKDHSLETANILVFYYDGDTEFDVKMYEAIGCEKEVKLAKRRHDNKDYEESRSEEEPRTSNKKKGKSLMSGQRHATHDVKETYARSTVFKSKHRCFIGIVGKNQYRMNIPKKLAVAIGLIKKERVELLDPNERLWPVKLRLDGEERHGGRLLMTEGLVECWHANNLSVGDKVVFELVNVEQSRMKIHIFRAGAGGSRRSIVLRASHA